MCGKSSTQSFEASTRPALENTAERCMQIMRTRHGWLRLYQCLKLQCFQCLNHFCSQFPLRLQGHRPSGKHSSWRPCWASVRCAAPNLCQSKLHGYMSVTKTVTQSYSLCVTKIPHPVLLHMYTDVEDLPERDFLCACRWLTGKHRKCREWKELWA